MEIYGRITVTGDQPDQLANLVGKWEQIDNKWTNRQMDRIEVHDRIPY